LRGRAGWAVDLATLFSEAPSLHPNVSKITGVICGVRIEEIGDPLMRKTRYMDTSWSMNWPKAGPWRRSYTHRPHGSTYDPRVVDVVPHLRGDRRGSLRPRPLGDSLESIDAAPLNTPLQPTSGGGEWM
jgi:uncharacterized protein DUF2200